MTNQDELWAELEKLADPNEAKKVEQARSRSNFAPPFTGVTCDVTDVSTPWNETLDNGRSRRVVSVWLENLRDVELADGRTLDSTDSFELRIPIPDKAQANGIYFLVVASIRALKPDTRSILDIKGAKGVRLEEDVHEYSGRGFIVDPAGTQTDRDGNAGYWGERKFETRYYAVKSLGKGSSNGSAAKAEAAPFVISDALRNAALAFLSTCASELDFSKGVLKDEGVRGVTTPAERLAFSASVTSGEFVKSCISDGLITFDGERGFELREAVSA
jgi:hypothetical protein